MENAQASTMVARRIAKRNRLPRKHAVRIFGGIVEFLLQLVIVPDAGSGMLVIEDDSGFFFSVLRRYKKPRDRLEAWMAMSGTVSEIKPTP